MSTARRKQQAQEADQLIRQMSQPEQEAAQREAEAATAAETDDKATDDASEQAVNDQGAEQLQQTNGTDGGDDQTTRSTEDDDAYWKHKYKSLDGIIRQRDQRIEQLGDIIANMQQSIATMQNQAPAQETAAPESSVSKEDVDTYGPDLVDLIRRVFKDEARTLEERLKQQFSGFESKMEKVESSVKETAKEKFESYLDSNAKGWRQIDSDPAFLEWVKASKVRHQQLAMSVQSLDAVAAAELFNMYAQMHKQVQAEQAAPRESRQRELEKQLAPGKSKQVGQDHRQADDKKQWTSSEIARAYAQRKSYSKQDWARQEREIAQAQAEGRVDYSR